MKDNTIKLYYARLNNMGDLLNVLIVKDIFGYDSEHGSCLDGELSAIGSGLEQFTFHGNIAMKLQQLIRGHRDPTVHVWGTGFINYAEKDPAFFRRDMRFCAVRGELSRRRAEKLTGKKLDIPTGDGGILAPMLLDEIPEKRYSVGIVPHICDLDDPAVQELADRYENSIIINVKDDPYEVLRQIAQCRCVLSSSLHGLIVADSFHIPNRHILFSDRPLGDGFKFDDYYSAYGVEHVVSDLREQSAPTLDEVCQGWLLTPEMVEQKKRDMLACFPFPSLKEDR